MQNLLTFLTLTLTQGTYFLVRLFPKNLRIDCKILIWWSAMSVIRIANQSRPSYLLIPFCTLDCHCLTCGLVCKSSFTCCNWPTSLLYPQWRMTHFTSVMTCFELILTPISKLTDLALHLHLYIWDMHPFSTTSESFRIFWKVFLTHGVHFFACYL